MKFLLAIALELFFDYFPPSTPVEQYLPREVVSVLEEKGWDIGPWEKKEENIWVFWNLGPKAEFGERPRDKMVLFTWEPPTTQGKMYERLDEFGKVFTWDDDLVDGKKFFKFYYPVLRQRGEVVPFEKKKFCTMIARRLSSSHPKQLYKERENTIRFFEKKRGEFDLYGMYWEKRKFKNWRGPVDDKMAVLKNYKFSICYENMGDVKGYITEKIFDCFGAGVVPVYWGASNVTDYIPGDCFIDRRKFKDNEEMYRFLKGMKKEEYEGYLERAGAFLKSEKARLFTAENLAKAFLEIIR